MTNTQNNHDSFDDFIDELNGEKEPAFGDPTGVSEEQDNRSNDEAFWEIIGNTVSENPDKFYTKMEAFKKHFVEFKDKNSNNETHNPDKFDEFVYVTSEERYYNRKSVKHSLKQGAFNSEMTIHIPRDDGKKVAGSAHWHFSENVRHFATALSYAPSEQEFFYDDGTKCFNTFIMPNYPAPKPYESSEAVKRVKAHLEKFYPEEAEHIIRWWAHNVQHPGSKMLWALAFIGIEGTGKSLSERVLSAAMTSRLVKNVSSSIINTQFTDWSWGSCVCFIDELSVENKKQTMDSFKDVITNKRLSINRKGISVLEGVRNTQNYVITSNHIDALPISRSDRRWLIADDKVVKLSDVTKEFGGDYYGKMMDAINNEAGELRSWLLSIDLTEFNTVIAPMTSSKADMYENTRSNDYHTVKELIDDHQLNPDMLSSKKIGWLYKEETGQKLHSRWLTTILRDIGLVARDTTVKDKQGLKHAIYFNPEVYDGQALSPEEIRKECQLDSDFKRV
jgi:hypothetical protein